MNFILECNGKINPLGVNKDNIRLGFKNIDEEYIEASRETNYQFQIATSEEKLLNNHADMIINEKNKGWHSIELPAEKLKDKTIYYWRVVEKAELLDERTEKESENKKTECLDDNKRKTISMSEIATFETGLTKWCGKWICGWNSENEDNKGKIQNFKRTFNINTEIQEARLYICGLGYFEAKINGHKTDDLMFKPLVTDYKDRIHPDNPCLYESRSHRAVYYTYDISDSLMVGENILSVDVADGYFYNVELLEDAWDFSFGTPRLIFEIHIKVNNEWTIIKSDNETLVAISNRESKLYAGDRIDYTLSEEKYKNSLIVDDDIYITEKLLEKPYNEKDISEYKKNKFKNKNIYRKQYNNEMNLVSSKCQEDRICDVIKPISVMEVPDGTLYDFGINHTGGLEFEIDSDTENKVTINYAEILNEDGTPNYTTGLVQRNIYKVNEGKTRIKPQFTWKCYRYACIHIEENARINNVKSLFIHMDIKKDGEFWCSDETLNKINDMFIQTTYCNLHSGLLTDCPHREKRPYTGDGNKIMKSVFYNMDAIPFFYKWLDDIEDAQAITGKITNTVPNFGGGGGYAWGNIICTLTKELYRYTGDLSVARRGYDIIKRWLDYYNLMRDDNYIIWENEEEWCLGDWLATDVVTSNIQYINTCCYYEAVESVQYLSGIVDETNRNKWTKLKEKIRDLINKEFFDTNTLTYGNGVQGEDVLALSLGIVPEDYINELKKKVENHYRKETDYHFDTGIVLTPILIEYLTTNGYEDIAYRMMTAKTYPSYYNLMKNETTFPEHWSKKWPDFYVGDIGNSKLVKGGGDLSHCHPMYGSVVSWLYEKVAGLDLSGLYEQVIKITPFFTEYLNEARASKLTPYGNVEIEWNCECDTLRIKTRIPNNLTGKLYFPSKHKKIKCLATGEIYEAKNGFFDFEVKAGISEFISL